MLYEIYFGEPVQVNSKLSRKLLSVLIAIVIIASFLNCAMAAPKKLVVQNVEIYPKVVKLGENVRVKAKLRNTGRNTIKGNAKALVGESVVEEFEEITIPPQDTVPLLFTVNTSSLYEGDYVVDLVVEHASSEQSSSEESIFDLGTLTIDSENAEPGSSGMETVEQDGYAGFGVLCLLSVFPVGGVVSFFVWKRQRGKSKEAKLSEDLLPNLLNEVLNFEENVETASKNKIPADRNYVC